MLNVKWLDVYEMIINQKKEIFNEIEKAKKQYLDNNVSYESFLEFEMESYIRLETLDNTLKQLDKIEKRKEVI